MNAKKVKSDYKMKLTSDHSGFFFEVLRSWSFLKSRWLSVLRTNMMGLSPSFLGGGGPGACSKFLKAEKWKTHFLAFSLHLHLELTNTISSPYHDSWSNKSSQQNLAEKPANVASCELLSTTLTIAQWYRIFHNRLVSWQLNVSWFDLKRNESNVPVVKRNNSCMLKAPELAILEFKI